MVVGDSDRSGTWGWDLRCQISVWQVIHRCLPVATCRGIGQAADHVPGGVNMLRCSVEIHAGYGAVPSDGDFVEPGDVLGLSVDSQNVVRAPVCGTVHLLAVAEGPLRHVHVQIWQDHDGFVADGSSHSRMPAPQ